MVRSTRTARRARPAADGRPGRGSAPVHALLGRTDRERHPTVSRTVPPSPRITVEVPPGTTSISASNAVTDVADHRTSRSGRVQASPTRTTVGTDRPCARGTRSSAASGSAGRPVHRSSSCEVRGSHGGRVGGAPTRSPPRPARRSGILFGPSSHIRKNVRPAASYAPARVDQHPHPTLLARLSALLMREPEDREQLLSMLHHAHERELLDADALSMIEGVMQVSELSARDIMVPRSQIDMIDIREKPEDLIPFVHRDGALALPGDRGGSRPRHRHPAREGPAALRIRRSEQFDIRKMLRPADRSSPSRSA